MSLCCPSTAAEPPPPPPPSVTPQVLDDLRITDIRDPDTRYAGDFDVLVTLRVSHGNLSMRHTEGLQVPGPGNGTRPIPPSFRGITFRGPTSAAAAAVRSLRYVVDPDFVGRDVLLVTVDDLGHVGPEGPGLRAEAAIVLMSTVPGDPTLDAPAALELNEDGRVLVSGAVTVRGGSSKERMTLRLRWALRAPRAPCHCRPRQQ